MSALSHLSSRLSRTIGPRRARLTNGAVLVLVLAFTQAACGNIGMGPATQVWSQGGMESIGPEEVSSSLFGTYLAGRMAQSGADTGAAADYYVRAFEAEPGNVTLARRAYFYLLTEGRTDEAMRLAARTLELDPGSSVAPLVLAAGAVSGGDYAQALAHVHSLPQRGLNAFMVPLVQAWALTGQGQIDAALQALDALHMVQGQLDQLHDFHAALILDLAGRTDEALDAYVNTLEGEGPLSLRSVQAVASFLRRNGQEIEALDLIDSYRQQHPGSLLIEAAHAEFLATDPQVRPVASAADGLAEAFYGAASSILQAGSHDTAMAFVRLALLLRPDFAYAQMMTGDILMTLNRFTDAERAYAALPEDSPVALPVRLRQAEALERLGRLEEAEALLETAIEANVDLAELHIQLGDFKRRQEDWTGAIAAYRNAFARLEEIEPRHWTLYFSLGVALERTGQWPEAEHAFLRSLELEPDHPLALNYLGYSWLERGENRAAAREMIEKAVAQRPFDGYIVDSLGWTYYLEGDYQRAMEILEDAVELTPGDPTINDHLGDAYWRVGRPLQARFQWQRALSLNPDDAQREALERKLRDGLTD